MLLPPNDDNSCDFSCYGCTNSEACNYDATATIDDGSCFLPDPDLDVTVRRRHHTTL